jgi:hypothetical protein
MWYHMGFGGEHNESWGKEYGDSQHEFLVFSRRVFKEVNMLLSMKIPYLLIMHA